MIDHDDPYMTARSAGRSAHDDRGRGREVIDRLAVRYTGEPFPFRPETSIVYYVEPTRSARCSCRSSIARRRRERPQGRAPRPHRGRGDARPRAADRGPQRPAHPRRRDRRRRALRVAGLPRLPRHLRRRHERHPDRRGLPRHRLRVPRELRGRGRDLRRADRLGRPCGRRGVVRRRTSGGARAGDRRRARGDRDRGPDHHELRAPPRAGAGARRRPPHGRRRRIPTSPASAWAATRPASRPGTSPTRSRSPARPGSASPSTPASGAAPTASAAASRWGSAGSATGSARSRIPTSCANSPSGARCSRYVPPATSCSASTRATRSTRCPRCARPACRYARLRRPAVLGRLDRRRVRGRRGAVRLRRRGAARDHADRAPSGLRGGGCPAAPPRSGLGFGDLVPRP